MSVLYSTHAKKKSRKKKCYIYDPTLSLIDFTRPAIINVLPVVFSRVRSLQDKWALYRTCRLFKFCIDSSLSWTKVQRLACRGAMLILHENPMEAIYNPRRLHLNLEWLLGHCTNLTELDIATNEKDQITHAPDHQDGLCGMFLEARSTTNAFAHLKRSKLEVNVTSERYAHVMFDFLHLLSRTELRLKWKAPMRLQSIIVCDLADRPNLVEIDLHFYSERQARPPPPPPAALGVGAWLLSPPQSFDEGELGGPPKSSPFLLTNVFRDKPMLKHVRLKLPDTPKAEQLVEMVGMMQPDQLESFVFEPHLTIPDFEPPNGQNDETANKPIGFKLLDFLMAPDLRPLRSLRALSISNALIPSSQLRNAWQMLSTKCPHLDVLYLNLCSDTTGNLIRYDFGTVRAIATYFLMKKQLTENNEDELTNKPVTNVSRQLSLGNFHTEQRITGRERNTGVQWAPSLLSEMRVLGGDRCYVYPPEKAGRLVIRTNTGQKLSLSFVSL